ncbi:hypothetical protein CASFOL_042997 [Castilleja foliolosa]|uniref:Uncharacterized protein n=1 Tax=Castilleja foliolosa TaxID=1961234 RepID=A0ABD3B7C1_9LAMI
MRNKGKVHPFSSSSPIINDSSSSPHLSVLNLLPAAIFTLVSLLSLDERHVLAYMITRSLKSTERKPKNKQQQQPGPVIIDSHGALFDCDCFHCYTTFWFRWDSSPNRELIHQAIEAFEDHLSNRELNKKKSAGWKSKRKDKSRRPAAIGGGPPEENLVNSLGPLESHDVAEMKVNAASPPVVNNQKHKGLARKMLPDVMGIFNSRLWSLWSPNVWN